MRAGDSLRIQLQSASLADHLQAEDIPLDIVYEDEYLLVVNKPAGLVVHPGAGNRSGTMVNALLHHCRDLSTINGTLRPGIVHRLDKNTSGLLVVAKTDAIHLQLVRQFETRDITRIYQAVVWGNFRVKEGEIESLINRSKRDRQKMTVVKNHGKWALTTYKVLQSYNYFSLVELVLKTGRTHQIRVHLNHIHHPVFGDPDYNGRQNQLSQLPLSVRAKAIDLLRIINRQALHAQKLSFIHPHIQQRMDFVSILPPDIKRLLAELAIQ